jgi:hypothetical protein
LDTQNVTKKKGVNSDCWTVNAIGVKVSVPFSTTSYLITKRIRFNGTSDDFTSSLLPVAYNKYLALLGITGNKSQNITRRTSPSFIFLGRTILLTRNRRLSLGGEGRGGKFREVSSLSSGGSITSQKSPDRRNPTRRKLTPVRRLGETWINGHA